MNELLESDYLQTIDELKQQNKEMYEALRTIERNLSRAWTRDRSSFEQALLDTANAILAKVDGKECE